MAYSVWLFFLSAVSSVHFFCHAQQLEYRYHICTNSSTYTANSTFQMNLNATLSSVYAHATGSSGFYNTSTGQNSDRVYGLFLCRGDTSPALCQSCIKTTSEEIVKRCPNRKEAIIWYDRCMLRYSNRSILSVAEEAPKVFLVNEMDVGNIMNISQFSASLGDLMNQLVTSAVSSNNLYATGDTTIRTTSHRLYGLVQCTPDISPSQCNICLSGSVSDIPMCCTGKQGGNVLKPSCSVRYEIYPFYTSPPASPPPASPPSSLTTTRGQDIN